MDKLNMTAMTTMTAENTTAATLEMQASEHSSEEQSGDNAAGPPKKPDDVNV